MPALLAHCHKSSLNIAFNCPEQGIKLLALLLTGSTGQPMAMGWPDIHWLARNLGWAGGSHCGWRCPHQHPTALPLYPAAPCYCNGPSPFTLPSISPTSCFISSIFLFTATQSSTPSPCRFYCPSRSFCMSAMACCAAAASASAFASFSASSAFTTSGVFSW